MRQCSLRTKKSYLEKTYPKPSTIQSVVSPKFTNHKEILKYFNATVVTIENEEGFGSGVIIDPNGLVLTNHHVVIGDTANLKIRIMGLDELVTANVVALNSDYDLALLKLVDGKYSSIALDDIIELGTGDVVYAIGTPLDKSLGQSVTKGIVSGFREFNGVSFIQTDVSINSGNSGGALVTEDGKFAGLSTMKASGKGVEGLGFCIPKETIIKALNLKLK